MTAAILISGAALCISLCSFWLSIRNYMRDRYKLRLDGFMLGTVSARKETFELGVEITNEGRRPVSVLEIYFETQRSGEFLVRTPIHGGTPDAYAPVTLAEHQTQRFMSRTMTLEEALALPRTVDILVRDSANRRYRVPVHNQAFEYAQEGKDAFD